MNFSSYANLDLKSVLEKLHAFEDGLSRAEAKKRLAADGDNLVSPEKISGLKIFVRQLANPFIFLLFGAVFLSVLLGEQADAIIILAFILLNSFLGFIQEYRSQKSLELLKKLVAHKARVLRGGEEISIDSKEIVTGDIVLIKAGDIIPADMRLLRDNNLSVDESPLTGESLPVYKKADPIEGDNIEIYQAKNICFSGSVALSGTGRGVVISTGAGTVMGNVSKLAVETYRESSFQKGIGKLSSFILKMIVVVLSFVFVINAFIKGGQNIFDLILFSVALAVSVVPEALPIVTTIALSKGAIKLAKEKVVVKRLSSLEDLGSIEILCSDKTGTLTEGKMKLVDQYGINGNNMIFYGALAGSLFSEEGDIIGSFDQAFIHALTPEEKSKIKEYRKTDEMPFDPERRRDSMLVERQGECMLIVRGAPEDLVGLSKNISAEEKINISRWIEEEGKKGNRVLAVGFKNFKDSSQCTLPQDEHSLELSGLASFSDPVKKDALEIIREAEELGVRIKILTGDSADVAGSVGLKVGLIEKMEEVKLGRDLDQLQSHEERFALVDSSDVFARVNPEQKYKIIELLKGRYEVGFLGEGINDAPALKLANVGIVVESASDISRDSADIILLERNLSAIIKGIRSGRETFENTIKYIKATLISNFGNFYTIAIVSLLISYLPMLPSQILLLNLLSDFPMIAISTDRVDESQMRRPKSYNIREILFISTMLGIVSTVFDFILFSIFNNPAQPGILQTNWFIGSVLTELALIFSVRTRLPMFKAKAPSISLSLLSVFAAAGAIILPFTSFGQKTFGFIRPEPKYILIIIGVAVAYLIITELVKIFYYSKKLNLHFNNGFFNVKIKKSS